METASWSSMTSTSGRELFADAGYPRHCDICPPSITFTDRFEMAHHLRRVHSTREGGSFICRYGPNGVCQTLPLEGVSDRDYEAHLRKCHISAASASKISPNAPSNEEIVDAKNKTFTVHRRVFPLLNDYTTIPSYASLSHERKLVESDSREEVGRVMLADNIVCLVFEEFDK